MEQKNSGAVGVMLLATAGLLMGYLTIPSTIISAVSLLLSGVTGLVSLYGIIEMSPRSAMAASQHGDIPGSPGYCAPARANMITGQYGDLREGRDDFLQQPVELESVALDAESAPAVAHPVKKAKRNRYNDGVGFVPVHGIRAVGWPTSADQIVSRETLQAERGDA